MLTSPATYGSILGAVARNPGRLGDIAGDVGIDSTTANKYLEVLRDVMAAWSRRSSRGHYCCCSRCGVYRIADRHVAFHFRHVQPHRSLIQAGRGERVLEESVQPDLLRLLDDARVDFVLDHLLPRGRRGAGHGGDR